MLVSATSLVSSLLLTASIASAAGHGPSSSHHHRRSSSHRAAALRRAGASDTNALLQHGAPQRRAAEKRCKVRTTSASASASSAAAAATSTSVAAAPTTTSSSSEAAAPTTTWAEEAESTTSVALALAVKPTPTSSSEEWVAPTTSTTSTWVAPTSSTAAAPVASATANSDGLVSGTVGALLSLTDAKCGWSGAVAGVTADAGPNGAQSWLNCGLNSGGWTPPFITLDEVVYADLSTVLAGGSSPFGPCAAYIDQMYAIGGEMNIPPIMIAAFAMQESTCNPNAVGGGGEQGMFQISQDKCGGAPGGNCKDVSYNMRTAMQYFRDTISSNGGDLLLSLGMYNGWYEGLTEESATAARWGSCCRCQNNLDYLQSFVNGFILGHDGHEVGTYHNLDVC